MPFNGSAIAGILAAQGTESTGLAINHSNSILAISQYNNAQTPKRILYVSSNGELELGYEDFTMRGHISQGARYLEDDNYEPYNWNNQVPVNFNNGKPQVIPPTGNIHTPIYINENNELAAMPQVLNSIDDDYKVVPALATSRIMQVSNGAQLTNDDNGKFIYWSNGTVKLPDDPILGFECEFMWHGSNNTIGTIASNSGAPKINTTDIENGASITISEKYGIIVIKFLGTDIGWLATGDID